MRGLVDHVDGHARCACGASKAVRLVIAVEAADGHRRGDEIRRPPRPPVQRDCARQRGRDSTKLVARVVGEGRDLGAGGGQKLHLPRDTRPIAGDDGALAREREKDRKPCQRLHARRSRLRRPACRVRARHQYTSC